MGGDVGDRNWRWWAMASSAQMVAGVASYRKGCAGDSCFMPFKAFFVASLFLGSGTTAIAGILHASGIHKVEDLKGVGSNIRNCLGVPPRRS